MPAATTAADQNQDHYEHRRAIRPRTIRVRTAGRLHVQSAESQASNRLPHHGYLYAVIGCVPICNRLFTIRLQALPKHTGDNINLYFQLHTINTVALLFVAIIREIMHFDALELILRKRVDERYFRTLKLVGDKAHGGQFRPALAFGAPNKPSVDSYRYWLAVVVFLQAVYLFSLEVETRFRAESGSLNEVQLNGAEYVKFLVTFIFVKTPCIFCVFLVTIMALICQYEGLVLVSLAIVAVVTDMLRRAKEQLRLTHVTCRRRVNSRGAAGQELIQVTELLVQVRDVLVMLKHVADISFALSTLNALLSMLLNVGLALALLSVDRHWYAFFCGYGFFWRLFRELSYRYMLLRLHQEANQIRDICLRRLANQSAEHRVDTLTNVKLAEQITQLDPTTWTVYKMESMLKASLSGFAFMVGLHRVAEVGFQASRPGH
jgi:hypothetical protein